MICNRCGATLHPGERTCPACGTPAGLTPFLDTDPVPGVKKPKKPRKGRVGWIVLIALVVLALAVGVVFHRVIGEFFLRTFTSPASYYQHVESRAIDQIAEHVGDAYARLILSEDGKDGWTSELTVAPKTDSLSWIDGLTVESTMQTDDGASLLKANVVLNGEQVLAVNAYSDADGTAVQIPLLNDSYFAPPVSDTAEAPAALVQALRASGLTRKEVTALTADVLTCVVQQLDDVTKSRGTAEAEDISQRCTVLHVTVSADDVQEIRSALDALLRSDAVAKKLVDAVASSGGTDADACVDALVDAVTAMLTDKGGEMDVCAAANGDVIGRDIRRSDGAALSYARPTSLSKRAVGLAASVRADDANALSLSGTLQKDTGTITCGLTRDGASAELCTIEYDALQKQGDRLSADYQSAFGDGLRLLVDNAMLSTATKGLTMEGSFSADEDGVTATAELQLLGADVADVSLRQERIVSESFGAVRDVVTMGEWVKSANYISAYSELKDTLKKAGVPSDTLRTLLLQLFKQALEQIS